ncbi:hypothetical protein RV05_GL001596 [Enterococcus hirae]|uniref:hypothetical protein n=1 Tax=Enterococcus hirae TaxID=1354 RepID=UPI00091DC7DF|nr:hypothetical protein [Enterococcus hirae]MDL4899085.1 hypothetical protein [Enterococcus hirae]OJG53270.1 hypothetical protein RV05_GL001596 [Enterococcus hirae]
MKKYISSFFPFSFHLLIKDFIASLKHIQRIAGVLDLQMMNYASFLFFSDNLVGDFFVYVYT